MPRHSHREKILQEGLKVVHAQGFKNASVRDIVQAAGVPQGSFTNHFASKEAFGLEVIGIYFEKASQVMAATLRNDDLPPLQRLRAYIDAGDGPMDDGLGLRCGCLLGNFAAEASGHSEVIRERLVEIFGHVRASVKYCLGAAVAAGEISPQTDCEEVAAFIVASLQGARLMAKTERSSTPTARFKEILFNSILQRTGQANATAQVRRAHA